MMSVRGVRIGLAIGVAFMSVLFVPQESAGWFMQAATGVKHVPTSTNYAACVDYKACPGPVWCYSHYHDGDGVCRGMAYAAMWWYVNLLWPDRFVLKKWTWTWDPRCSDGYRPYACAVHIMTRPAPQGPSVEGMPASADSVVPPEPPPVRGDTLTVAYVDAISVDMTPDSFYTFFDSASFLQVYLDNILPGDSAVAQWRLIANGDTSRVRLVGHVLWDTSHSVIPTMTRLFTGLPYTLTPFPNGAYALSFGMVQVAARGTVEESDLEIIVGEGGRLACDCPCHGDPQCDGVPNVQDVVKTIDVAFRGVAPVFDPACPRERTDVTCDGTTSLTDVVRIINVAFRGGDPVTEFCDPCVQ
ncbi:MAG: hypothetical protein AB1792_04020 [Candidatus Zixiibacteriota bacterium]